MAYPARGPAVAKTGCSFSLSPVFRFEAGQREPQRSNIEKIQAELERRGIEFSNGTGIGIRLSFEKAAEFARVTAPAPDAPGR